MAHRESLEVGGTFRSSRRGAGFCRLPFLLFQARLEKYPAALYGERKDLPLRLPGMEKLPSDRFDGGPWIHIPKLAYPETLSCDPLHRDRWGSVIVKFPLLWVSLAPSRHEGILPPTRKGFRIAIGMRTGGWSFTPPRLRRCLS